MKPRMGNGPVKPDPIINPSTATREEWEMAVFDRATLFTAVTMLGQSGRTRLEFATPMAAMEAALAGDRRTVTYAVFNQHHIVMDRADWLMWTERYLQIHAGKP